MLVYQDDNFRIYCNSAGYSVIENGQLLFHSENYADAYDYVLNN